MFYRTAADLALVIHFAFITLVIAGALLVFGEITWWLAVVLLGKELVEACRYYWKKVKARVGLAGND